MNKAKTRKSILKRFKITKNGKILRRATGQDHYLSKQSGKQRRAKRKWVVLSGPEARIIKRFAQYKQR